MTTLIQKQEKSYYYKSPKFCLSCKKQLDFKDRIKQHCSRECYLTSIGGVSQEQYNLQPKKCKQCNGDIHYKKKQNDFCSASCAASHNNVLFHKRKKTKQCKSCATLISANRSYCPDCLDKGANRKHGLYSKRLLRDVILNGSGPNVYSGIRYHARSVVSKRAKKCENCGYEKHIEVCHIKPIKSFPGDTLVENINASNNLILLCPNCHWEFDNGLLKISLK